MNDHWPNLKKAIEGAINSVQKNDRAGFRLHTSSAERIAGDIAKHAKGEERDHAKQVEKDVHNAKNSIDLARAAPILSGTLPTVGKYLGTPEAK